MATIRSRRILFHLPLILGCLVGSVAAQVLEPEALQRKQEDQQRARTMTRELLGGVLDVQLRQLEENGLSDQEIYRDIKLMRQNLNHLVETEMSRVVDLLAEAQRLPPEKREAAFVEARQQIRAVVRQLSVERQNLLKRLKIAELAEQVRRLIRQQATVQTATKGLIAETATRKESLTLKTIEDQRDAKELFLHLVDTMVDMKSWSGLLAVAAADGLRILKTAEVGKHFDEAGRQLKALKYETAVDEQELVIKGLRELLKVIERTQGALNSENMKSIDRLRAITDRQKQLRDETRALADGEKPSAEMVERQAELQKEIVKLTDRIRDNAKADSHIQQAETAAMDAAANLLDAKLDQAVADQGRVLGNLAALEMTLKDQAKQESRDKSANDLANTVKQLQEARTSLAEAQKKQDSVEAQLQQNAQAASADAKAVAEVTQNVMDKFDLPATVETALAEATQAAREASKNLDAAAAEKATAVEQQAVMKAGDALDRAVATIDAALMEVARQESAVKIGELARAAEVLERAASEERSIAREASQLAQVDSADASSIPQDAKGLADRQHDIHAIAEKAAEALALTAPAAANGAKEAAAKSMQSQADLQAIADQKTTDTKETATKAAESATEASQKFADAARQIRDEIVTTAKDLAARTTAQAEQLAEARAAVEKAVDQLVVQDKVAQLEAARNQLGQAMQEQAKAQGKPEAALAMDLASQIATALDAQDAAAAAANAVKAGVGSELKATTKQEEVAEKIQAAADASAKRPQAEVARKASKPDSLTQTLAAAQQAAAQAAKQTLDGNQAAAEDFRHTAETALKQALQAAQAEALAASEAAPTGSPDKQAQSKAAAATKESQATAAKASQEAGAEVAPAATATNLADQMLATNSPDATTAQSKAAESLKEAGKKLDAAIEKAASDQAQGLAKQSVDAAALADQVAKVDPAAADAIDSAAKATMAGSEAHDSPRQMADAVNTAELALEHAAADLGAKEQEIRRDQAIAESVANLAQGQQSAAEVIAEKSGQLEKMGAIPDDGPSDDQQSAAQMLNDAQQEFAESQRATGQGAVELSGQTEVANQPLREALELASKLPAVDYGTDLAAEAMLPDGQMVPAESSAEGQPVASPTDSAGETPTTDGTPVQQEAPSGESQREAGKGTKGKPNALGTGFVPNSPQLTAEMMAGSKAQKAAQKALSQQVQKTPKGDKPEKSANTLANNTEKGEPLESEHADGAKLAKKDGATPNNQKVKDGPIEKQQEGTDAAPKSSSKARDKDENIAGREKKEEAWFAKLPPELRKSIRAGAGQKPPRAYEERLKNYFQSVD